MTPQKAQNKIEEAGGSWEVFQYWMCGQTCPFIDGKVGYYEYDVERFIRYKCDTKNEPPYEVD